MPHIGARPFMMFGAATLWFHGAHGRHISLGTGCTGPLLSARSAEFPPTRALVAVMTLGGQVLRLVPFSGCSGPLNNRGVRVGSSSGRCASEARTRQRRREQRGPGFVCRLARRDAVRELCAWRARAHAAAGADVTHPMGFNETEPSIAAVVGSLDGTCSRFASRIRIQGHRVEIISDLKGIIKELLLDFYRANGNRKPERLIFYRDGVSEGQFAEVWNPKP
jgi:Piwi domain